MLIIVSSDENPIYISFWPTISKMFQLAGYKIVLGLITNRNLEDPYIQEIKQYGDGVHLFTPSEKYNVIIQSKLLRFYLTKFYSDQVVCIHDIDWYFMDNHQHVEDMIDENVLSGQKIATLGYNAYFNMNDKFKSINVYRFPASPTVAKGKLLFNLFSLQIEKSFHEFLDELYYYEPDEFDKNIKRTPSDETVILKILSTKPNWVHKYINYIPRLDLTDGNVRRIDRCNNLELDHVKMSQKYYIDVQPTRPYHPKDLKQILDYLKIPESIQNIRLDKMHTTMISGFEFHKFCEWSVCNRYPIIFNPHQVNEDDFVFLNLDLFSNFVNYLKQFSNLKKFILVTHNSDQCFTKTHFDYIEPYVSKIYAINCVYRHDKLKPIPIGFVDDCYKSHATFQKIKNLCKSHLLYVNFTINTNPIERKPCMNYFSLLNWVHLADNRNYIDYIQDISESKFVICPAGTGIDCHRIYEALYTDTIPILKTSPLDYFYKKLPVVIVNKWEQVNQAWLESIYNLERQNLENWKNRNKDWTHPNFWIKFALNIT